MGKEIEWKFYRHVRKKEPVSNSQRVHQKVKTLFGIRLLQSVEVETVLKNRHSRYGGFPLFTSEKATKDHIGVCMLNI